MGTEVDEPLCLHAARLTADRGLRTLDALHLASALAVADENLVLATWDRRLSDGARERVTPVRIGCS